MEEDFGRQSGEAIQLQWLTNSKKSLKMSQPTVAQYLVSRLAQLGAKEFLGLRAVSMLISARPLKHAKTHSGLVVVTNSMRATRSMDMPELMKVSGISVQP